MLKWQSKVEVSMRTSCLSKTNPGDLLPNLALLHNKMTLMSSSLEKVARLEESSVLATLEQKAEKRKSFPFRSANSDLLKEKKNS